MRISRANLLPQIFSLLSAGSLFSRRSILSRSLGFITLQLTSPTIIRLHDQVFTLFQLLFRPETDTIRRHFTNCKMQFTSLLSIVLFALIATAQFVGPSGQRFCVHGAISCTSSFSLHYLSPLLPASLFHLSIFTLTLFHASIFTPPSSPSTSLSALPT